MPSQSLIERKQAFKRKAARIQEKGRTSREKESTSQHCSDHEDAEHPDHSSELNRLRRIQGQLFGIETMIRERRYCPEVLVQFRASISALRVLENSIFERHLRGCVKNAMTTKNPAEVEEKVQELLDLLSKRT